MIHKLMSRAAGALAVVCAVLGLSGAAFAQEIDFRKFPDPTQVQSVAGGVNPYDTAARRMAIFAGLVQDIRKAHDCTPTRCNMPREAQALTETYATYAVGSLSGVPQSLHRRLQNTAEMRSLDPAFVADWRSKLLTPETISVFAAKDPPAGALGPPLSLSQPLDFSDVFVPKPFDMMSIAGPYTVLAVGAILLGLAIFFAVPMLVSPVSLHTNGERPALSFGGKTFALIATSGRVTSGNEWRNRTIDTSTGSTLSDTQTQDFTIEDSSGKKHPYTAVNRGLRMDHGDGLTVFQLQRSRRLWFFGIYNHASERFFGTNGGVWPHIKLGFLSCLCLTFGVIVLCVGAVIAHQTDVGGYDYESALSLEMTWLVALSGLAVIPILFFLKARKASSAAEAMREKCLRPFLAKSGAAFKATGARIADDGSITMPDGSSIRPG